MRVGNWGKEPFDLRLTILRMIRCLPAILGVTLAGTLLLGGWYALKNIVLRPADPYTARAMFLVDYVDEDWANHLKYINEYSWNIWMQSDVFQDFVRAHLPERALEGKDLGAMLKVTVPSDLRVAQVAATADGPDEAELLLEAVKAAMTEDFPTVMEDVKGISLTDSEGAKRDIPDVRPVRAFVLAAVVSFCFAVLGFVFLEQTLERIWLPTTLTNLYGIKNADVLGTDRSDNDLNYFFQEKRKIALIPARDGDDLQELIEQFKERKTFADKMVSVYSNPMKEADQMAFIRECDGVLLALKAGEDAKYLELLLNQLGQQDISVTAGILWKADGWLIRRYYSLGEKGRGKRF